MNTGARLASSRLSLLCVGVLVLALSPLSPLSARATAASPGSSSVQPPAPPAAVALAAEGDPALHAVAVDVLQRAGVDVQDVSDLHARLFAPLLDITDETPPPGWPGALLPTWERVLRDCTRLRTKPAFDVDDPAASMCARGAPVGLWQAFLDEARPPAVVELGWRKRPVPAHIGEVETLLVARRYEPENMVAREIAVVVTDGDADAAAHATLAAQAVADLLAGRGTAVRRVATRELPVVRGADDEPRATPPPIASDRDAVRVNRAVTVPVSCALPRELVVRGPSSSSSSRILAATWRDAIDARARRGESARCDLLELHLPPGELDMGAMQAWVFALRCEHVDAAISAPGLSPATALGASLGHAGLQRVVDAFCAVPTRPAGERASTTPSALPGATPNTPTKNGGRR